MIDPKKLILACVLLTGHAAFAELSSNAATEPSEKPGTDQAVISLETLLHEMVDRSALSKAPRPAYTAKSVSSYDRESKVNNPADGLYVETDGRDWGKGWFANRDFAHSIREEINDGRKESVMMEDIGPGAIVRWWAPSELKRVRWSPSTGRDIIRVYIDGSTTPVIEMRPDELVGGNGLAAYPFSLVVSNDEVETKWRGRNLYLPIPYEKSCKVTWEGTPFYYQIGYRSYAPGTKVESFTMEQLESAKDTLMRVGEQLTAEDPVVDGAITEQSNVLLKPGQSTTLSLRTPGAITELLVQLSAEDYQQALRSTVVSMHFDGQRTAWLPIGALGGVGYSAKSNETFYIKTDPETGMIASYYVMPFQATAEITLTNYSEQDVAVGQFALKRDDYQWDDSSLYFNATWFEQRDMSTRVRRDLNYVTVLGAGRYVGTSITVFNASTEEGGWWGEGDDKVYVDGETFPSIFGTGTEDYFGYAWCRPEPFNTPFISQPRGEGNLTWGYSNNNRYHLLDDIPFDESIQFDMEIWHAYRSPMNYAATTFFYARPGSHANVVPSIDSVKRKVALDLADVQVVE